MLVIYRQSGTGLQIGPDVKVFVRMTPHGLRLAVDAPRELLIDRIDGNGKVELRKRAMEVENIRQRTVE